MVYLLRVAFYVYKLAKNEEKKIMIADRYYSVNSRIKYSMFYTWNVYSKQMSLILNKTLR